MLLISIQHLEEAINYWRSQSPSRGEELTLCAEATALAKPYALMILQGAHSIPLESLSDEARRAFQNFLSKQA